MTVRKPVKVDSEDKNPDFKNGELTEAAAEGAESNLEDISDYDAIAQRAYQLWIEHGRISGFDVETWRDAERWFEEQKRHKRRLEI